MIVNFLKLPNPCETPALQAVSNPKLSIRGLVINFRSALVSCSASSQQHIKQVTGNCQEGNSTNSCNCNGQKSHPRKIAIL